MIKAFWISLVDPANTSEIINEELKSKAQVGSGKKSGSLLGSYNLFGKKKQPKGRKLNS